MKVSKVFGCVFGLHVGVVGILLVQSGCQSTQPPTQVHTQSSTQIPAQRDAMTRSQTSVQEPDWQLRPAVPGSSRVSMDSVDARRAGDPEITSLDAAFNAGFEGDEFAEFDRVEPIRPLGQTGGGAQTVPVAGESFEAYTVKRGDSLWAIARRYNISINELYAANGLNKDSVLRVGQQIQIPTEGGSAEVRTVTADSYQPSSLSQETTTYVVKTGDSLSRIASQNGTTVNAIKAANNKTSDMIRVGERLLIPVSGSAATAPSQAAPRAVAASSSASAGSAQTTDGRTHTVKAGEFPAVIARQYGMTTNELLALNGITDPRRLQVGQVLQVSGSGSAANVDSRAETVVAPPAARSQPTPTPARTPTTTPSGSPVQIQVVEADPLVEGDDFDLDTETLFEGAVEIPVIRLEE